MEKNEDKKEKKLSSNDIKKLETGIKLTYWFIVVFGVTFIVSTAVNIGIKMSEKNNIENYTSKEEVSEEVKNILLDLVGIKANNVKFQKALFDINGVINESDSFNKVNLIYESAKERNLLEDVSNEYCGTKSCDAISISNFNKTALFLGIKDEADDLLQNERIYNGFCLFIKDNEEVNDIIEHISIKAEYLGKDIVLSDKIKHTVGESTTESTVVYTFKIDKNNDYYLYSVTKN